MNLKALITTLAILGSSSVAMARPATFSASAHGSWTFGTKPTPAPIVRDHRYPRPAPIVVRNPNQFRPDYRSDYRWHVPQPLLLAESLRFSSGETRKFITVGAAKGGFRKVHIQAAGGSTFIKQIAIIYTDGHTQVIRNVNRLLWGNQMVSFDLDGNKAAIGRIVVYGGDSHVDSRYRVNGAFHVTAL